MQTAVPSIRLHSGHLAIRLGLQYPELYIKELDEARRRGTEVQATQFSRLRLLRTDSTQINPINSAIAVTSKCQS